MSHSLPSEEVFVVDVPEAKKFDAIFDYNFFVPDEQVSEISNIPSKILNKKSEEIDAEYVQYVQTRAPRFVKFTWEKISTSSSGNQVTETDIRKNAAKRNKQRNLIKNNYEKIISENKISSQNYVDVTFQDNEIDNKLYSFVSGSYALLTSNEFTQANTSYGLAAAKLNAITPKNIDQSLIYKSLVQPKYAYGVSQYKDENDNSSRKSSVKNESIDSLKKTFINTQINSKLLNGITSRNIKDPFSPYTLDLEPLYKESNKFNNKINKNNSVSESRFKTVVPYIDIRVDKASSHAQRTVSEIVGYIIDKSEIGDDGVVRQLPPIIIESSHVNVAYDLKVRYNQTYCYSIRTIALFSLPAVDYENGQLATIQVLVSSKPIKRYVTAREDVAPPPPSDINFTWNYETDKLLIHWAFPPNPQRDIKKFQVFRRKTINEPFELLKEYDFDDSLVKSIIREKPASKLIEKLTSPATFYTDDDFTKDSKYIYTICCIDAHGLTSNYGAQFELSFDRFKNQLYKTLISHRGAPKPYPNLYIPGKGFVDVAHVGGNHTKRLSLYFVPQFYELEDEKGRMHRVLSTNQTNGMYKFQFINVDNQKSETITVKIDDRLAGEKPTINFDSWYFIHILNTKNCVWLFTTCNELAELSKEINT